ncbi:hypothetical protein PHMEG_00029996 [Phytophthora megakarya]|uniref:Polyprotein n=1 Tax=Phytophthora megakarya TaxID=4795 RepID=A0A225V1N1_9STRA|nr:hypothetical protein PHMEG_00029996 [Phytophthora megakarya]
MACVARNLGKYDGAFTRENFLVAKRVIIYLIGSKHKNLVHRKSEALPMLTADHAMGKDTSGSNTGFVRPLAASQNSLFALEVGQYRVVVGIRKRQPKN